MVKVIEHYQNNYYAAIDWIVRSERKEGGSSAYFAPILGWSKPYPETTGYIIPTLLDAYAVNKISRYQDLSYRFGEWLLSIQDKDGYWSSGLHPSTRKRKPSLFNTGQILLGLMRLWKETNESKWIESSTQAVNWLVNGLTADELWGGGDYRNNVTSPSYYSHLIWPILEYSTYTEKKDITLLCKKALEVIITRRNERGGFTYWGFESSKPAFTHNIAYTLKGIQESGRLLQSEEILHSVDFTIERLIRLSELNAGKLPGALTDNLERAGNYVCLTGNLQIAECMLTYESSINDLRIVNAAARLIDFVCSRQAVEIPINGIKGAVAGSSPFFGAYMRLRYPNWACKYLCDAILKISSRVKSFEGS